MKDISPADVPMAKWDILLFRTSFTAIDAVLSPISALIRFALICPVGFGGGTNGTEVGFGVASGDRIGVGAVAASGIGVGTGVICVSVGIGVGVGFGLVQATRLNIRTPNNDMPVRTLTVTFDIDYPPYRLILSTI